MVPGPLPDAGPQSFSRCSLLVGGLLLAWLSAGSVPVMAQGLPCGQKGNERSTLYQERQKMRRCEGEEPKEIAASGIRLANFTIGVPRFTRSPDGGQEIRLRIPTLGRSKADPEVWVVETTRNYRMKPLAYIQAPDRWRDFSWGASVLHQLSIQPQQLRTTALLKGEGDADRVLPVLFAADATYSIEVAFNPSLRLRVFRVIGPDGAVVEDFLASGNSTGKTTWDARRLPRGTYTIQARTNDPASKPLLLQVQHDPRWLRP